MSNKNFFYINIILTHLAFMISISRLNTALLGFLCSS